MSATENAIHEELKRESFLKTLTIFDWVFAALLVIGAVYAYQLYNYLMDSYEIVILFGATALLIGLGWWWKAMRIFMIAVAAISLLAVTLYGPAVNALMSQGMDSRDAIAALASLADKTHSQFLFKYFLSSTSAIMWMSALFIMATLVYFFHLATRNVFAGKVATAMTWTATTMGIAGLMIRWRESYLISADVGHIPVSNLYEVFILFSVITALIYLYYEGRYKTKAMGGFVLLVISAAIGFLLWYHFSKGANEIAPLVPALKSYWMKIHVPANFIGYGSFSLAAMLGMFFLFIEHAKTPKLSNQIVAQIIIFLIAILSLLGTYGAGSVGIVAQNLGLSILICGGFWIVGFGIVRGMRAIGPANLPRLELLDDIMHKSIALGFGFFTIATILGAAWAAEAWGGYWSWDPKETWALIVWLNYAAWLHMRLMKGLRGTPLAWWSVVGLLITTFAFIGVNIFLSGLHSYGTL
jgi:cytochrome c-type biogenesis protein CcsB